MLLDNGKASVYCTLPELIAFWLFEVLKVKAWHLETQVIYGEKINISLYKVSPPTISFQLGLCILEEFQDVCVIVWKFLTGIIQLWKTYEIPTRVHVNLLYQIK